ncbi:MAG: recombinase family protein, partial [Solirubrobacteraceae bacterium]
MPHERRPTVLERSRHERTQGRRCDRLRAGVHRQAGDLALQLDALNQVGCARVFADTASGSLRTRPDLEKCLDYPDDRQLDPVARVGDTRGEVRSAGALDRSVDRRAGDGEQLGELGA